MHLQGQRVQASSERQLDMSTPAERSADPLPGVRRDMNRNAPSLAQIEQLIRVYLQDHPHALDTERGIREWWLRDVHPPPSAKDVATAVANLVAAGELRAITLAGGRVAFGTPRNSDPHCP